MSGRVVFFNGRFIPEQEARLSIFDSALITGNMAFESTRTFGGEPFELRTHLNRLYGTLAILEIDCGLSLEEMEAVTRETLAKNQATEAADVEWQIVHNVSPGPLEAYRAAFSEPLGPTVCINCWPLIGPLGRFAPLYEQGVRVVIPQQRVLPPTFIDPRAKTRSRVHARLAQLQANQVDRHSWPLLLDADGYLAEGPAWNVFLVLEGILLTPSARNVLPGVSRSITIRLAQAQGIPVGETDLTVADAMAAEELFCTATSFCLVHVRQFEGQAVGDGTPGPVTQQLIAGWKQHVGLDFPAQAQEYAKRLPAWEAKERPE